jgi:hypothetical protein
MRVISACVKILSQKWESTEYSGGLVGARSLVAPAVQIPNSSVDTIEKEGV